jgi:Copper transport outer membrane protein, MctB
VIDFRYHLVSIVAVFLALAIGIVVGAQAITPKLADSLNKASAAEVKQNKMLYAHNQQLKNEIAADGAFAQAAEGRLLRGLLDGEHVALVLAPGTDNTTVDGLTSALQLAGASVTGQVVLSSQFFDTSAGNEQQLKNSLKGLTPPGVTLPVTADSSPQVSGQQAVAQVIAASIMDKNSVPTLTPAQSQQVIARLTNAGFLQINGPNGSSSLAGQATLAVVVVPTTVPPPSLRGLFNLALISVTNDLQEASKGVVLTGPLTGTGPHSAIEAVSSGSAKVNLTTVDNAETTIGQIVVAQALSQMVTSNATPTAYGVRPGVVPSPAPSASPSPSPSTQPSSKKGRR